MKYYTHISSMLDDMIDDISYIERKRTINSLKTEKEKVSV